MSESTQVCLCGNEFTLTRPDRKYCRSSRDRSCEYCGRTFSAKCSNGKLNRTLVLLVKQS